MRISTSFFRVMMVSYIATVQAMPVSVPAAAPVCIAPAAPAPAQ